MDPTSRKLDDRLAAVAAQLALPGLGVPVDEVIDLAVDLLVADRDTAATAEVASFSPGSTLRDSEGAIRQMLTEQRVGVPVLVDPEDTYRIALWAFGVGGIGAGEFSQWFYSHVPAWDEQDQVDRALVVLLDDWERESDPARRADIAATMRGVAAAASGEGSD